MSASENKLTDKPAKDFTKTWRYTVGLFMIVVGNLGIVIALALPFFGVPAAVVGALVVGGEIVSVGSIVFLGKEGFKAIKNKIFAFSKASYTAPSARPATRSASPCCAPTS